MGELLTFAASYSEVIYLVLFVILYRATQHVRDALWKGILTTARHVAEARELLSEEHQTLRNEIREEVGEVRTELQQVGQRVEQVSGHVDSLARQVSQIDGRGV